MEYYHFVSPAMESIMVYAGPQRLLLLYPLQLRKEEHIFHIWSLTAASEFKHRDEVLVANLSFFWVSLHCILIVTLLL